MSDTVIIAGGGIGGLTAAMALHKAGVSVRLFERVAEVRPLGVGINLLPHSVRVLTDLGLQADLAASGIETADLSYYNRFGQLIWREPRGRAAGYAVPQFSLHRGELQMILLAAAKRMLGPDRIVTGHRLLSADEDADGVAVTFERSVDGERVTVRGAALIGADGIHSTVRKWAYPEEGGPKYGGRVLWRATIEGAPFLSGRSMFMAGHADQKFVCYPISRTAADRGRSLINWIAELAIPGDEPPHGADWNRKADKADFLPAFEDWTFDWLDIPRLIRETAEVYEFPMVDRDPLPAWSFGRRTLLGDAAHPMYPIGSNGASQAILDAEALAARFQAGGSVPAILKAYEGDRLGPTADIVRLNRRQGPEQVMQRVHERAPDGFDRLEDVIGREELEEVAARYKQTAGFDLTSVNVR